MLGELCWWVALADGETLVAFAFVLVLIAIPTLLLSSALHLQTDKYTTRLSRRNKNGSKVQDEGMNSIIFVHINEIIWLVFFSFINSFLYQNETLFRS